MLFNSGLAFLLVSAVLANQNPQLSKRDEKSNRWAGVEALGESNVCRPSDRTSLA